MEIEGGKMEDCIDNYRYSQKIKKLVYVGKTLNNSLENLTKEYNIIITTRYENEFNITSLFKEDLRAINNIDFLVLDISAFVSSSSNEEIIRNLDKLRHNYEFRIILIASGYRKGNQILAECFNMGIYNLVTASTDNKMYDELRICLDEKGMSYAQASQYRMVALAKKDSNKSIIKTEYKKIKQDISIGIVGITRHIGTTTWGINLLHFLNELPNIKSCYIEANLHNDIIDLTELEKVGDLGIEHFPSAKEVRIGGMEMYYDLTKIGDITSQNYDFYIYDFGEIGELTDLELASFLNKDIKFIIMGDCPWEYKYISETFEKVRLSEEQDRLYFIYNFVKKEKQKDIKAQMGKFNVYFNEIQEEPFELKSKEYLESILRRYFSDSYFSEDIKKKGKFRLNKIFKKLKKG